MANSEDSKKIEDAFRARTSNISGANGELHQQDNYVVSLRSGDVVIPPEQLTPNLIKKLRKALGSDLDKYIVGKGRELKHYSDGS